jgi:predicted amidophosphoribosyltransferase
LALSCAQLFWPACCAGCDVLVPSDEVIFCAACAASMNPLARACAGCALPGGEPPTGGGVGCRWCARGRFAFGRAFAGFEYGEALAGAIVRMKHGDRVDLAGRLGRLLAATVARALNSDGEDDGDRSGDRDGAPDRRIDAVLPVPLHPRKLRQRGFNQALALARVALGRVRASCAHDQRSRLPRIERELLSRVRDTRELGRSGPSARRAEVQGAFAVTDPGRARDRRFLLVDDVMTTGATLHACAETLVRAGAREVWVAALARAVL